MKLYILRHGESEYNVRKLVNSNPTVPNHLTENGRKQAERAANELKKIKFNVIYSSPLPRARETAEILRKKLKSNVIIDDRLREISAGFEGKPAKDYNEAAAKFGDILNFKPNGKESYLELKERIKNFLEDLKAKKYKNVLIVTHEWGITTARSIIKGTDDLDSLAAKIKNAEWLVFEL